MDAKCKYEKIAKEDREREIEEILSRSLSNWYFCEYFYKSISLNIFQIFLIKNMKKKEKKVIKNIVYK